MYRPIAVERSMAARAARSALAPAISRSGGRAEKLPFASPRPSFERYRNRANPSRSRRLYVSTTTCF
jgi:hypothetical protein